MDALNRHRSPGGWQEFAAAALAAIFLTLSLCPASVHAREQVVIQKTITNPQVRAADAFLDQQNPTNNNSAGVLQVRSQSGSRNQRTLVLLDLSQIPNAGVKQATLTLHVSGVAPARTYGVYLVTSFWNETGASWNNRAVGVNNVSSAWGAAGGDFNGTATNSQSTTAATTSVSWDITQDLQSWYNGTPNYGTLIRDNTENSGTARAIAFNSKEDANPALRPSLTINFLQNVQNLTSLAGNGSMTLNWSYPALIGTPVAGETYAGVVILRRAVAPVDKGSAPADGSAPPALCSTVGTGTVVFVSTMANTGFTDNGTCSALTNGTAYFYKVFLRDSANNYTSNPAGLGAPRDGSSTFTAETCGIPGTVGNAENCSWMLGTHSANLAPPGLVPSSQVSIGSDTSLLFGVDANTGQRLYPPVMLGGIVSGTPPILDASLSSIGKQEAYVAAQDGYVYAIDTLTGQTNWLTNLSSVGTAGNTFTDGVSVQVKQFSGPGYTLANDLVIVGTHNAGTTSGNSIIAVDANTGAAIWTRTGSAGGTPPMDMINSSPAIDYVNNAIWVASRSNGGNAQPNLWKLNPNTGAVLFSVNLANSGDIDSSPTLSAFGDVLFVGANSGVLYAVNPVTGAILNSFNGADGAIRSFPYVISSSSPYTVVISTSTKVQAVSFNTATSTFAALWAAPPIVNNPSAPVVSDAGKVYVGSGDGFVFEINLASGTVSKQRTVDVNYPAFVGIPGLDVVTGRLYVSTINNDQRIYAYPIPF